MNKKEKIIKSIEQQVDSSLQNVRTIDQNQINEYIDCLLERCEDLDYFYFHARVKDIYFDANY